MSQNEQERNEEAKRCFDSYTEYTKMLRAWLVAYGIGGPILFLTKKEISEKIAQSPDAKCIVYLFLIGMALQIGLAVVNKWLNWYVYSLDSRSSQKCRWWHTFVRWLIYQFWIDMVCDLLAIGAFVWATLKVVLLFV